MDGYRISAPAKVNLCLAVGDIRPDGYHNVDTVLHVLDLADEVRIEPAEKLALVCEPSVGIANERNLAWKAAVAFGKEFDVHPDVQITIAKRIPPGAGLAGGSTDGSAVLAGLATMHGIDLTHPGLGRAAQCLGADALFFLQAAAAHMRGRGDELVQVLPALDAPLVLVKPNQPVHTAAAYAAFDSAPHPPADCSRVVDALMAGEVTAVAEALGNNLEVPAATVVPDVAVVLAWLEAQDGVLGSLLAGSGSSAFALTDTNESAEKIADAARSKGWWAVATSLSSRRLTVEPMGAS